MNGLPYYPRYPRDFFDGTNGMPFELKAAYSLLLDLIYMCGGQLYDEPRFIAGHMNCSVRAWGGYRAALIERGKIRVQNGIISNFRADKELIIQRSFRDKQRINASQPRRINSLDEATAQPKPSHTDTDTDTDKKEEIGKPISCATDRFGEFWNAYPHRNGAKKGRAKAEAVWQRQIKARADPQDIIEGASRYAADRQVLSGYAKDPTTWLNGKCWNDEIEPTDERTAPNGKPDQQRSRLDAFLAGASAAPPMDSRAHPDASQPLLARR